MAYTKIKWVNNQTKLSATNLNHMEQGIADANDAALEAQNTATEAYNLAVEAKDIADSIGDVDISGKQDKLVSGVNIKTINGQSILGFGNIEVAAKAEEGESSETPVVSDEIPYSEVDGVSLDTLIERGVYLVSNASDSPVNTANSGILHVSKLSNNKIEQEWLSDTNRAIRLLSDETPEGVEEFTVDGVRAVPVNGIVELASGGTYVLSGTLAGAVKIDGTAKYTTVKLNNVTIKSSGAYAICNNLDNRLTVEVLPNTYNYIIVDDQETVGASSDMGAIHSEGDLTVYGNGLLGIKSTKGHGFKGEDMRFGGYQKVYIDAYHDAIHSRTLRLTEGNYYIKDANDAISAGSSGHTGIIRISGGNITVEHCKEDAFQAKTDGSIDIYGKANITLLPNFSSGEAFNAASVRLYNTITLTGVEHELIDLSAVPATIEPSGNNIYEVEDNIYTIKNSCTLSGNFSGYKIIVPNQSINLTLNNVYYKNEDESDTDAFIDYIFKTDADNNPETPDEGKGRIKLILANDSINYIYKQAGSCVASSKNIEINNADNVIGDIYIECPNGYGLYAPNGDVRMLNDGARYIENCNIGIYTNFFHLGEDAEKLKNTAMKDSYIYVRNSTVADVKLINRINSDGLNIAGKITAMQNNVGLSIIEKMITEINSEIGASEFEPSLTAASGEIVPKNNSTTVRAATIYYKQAIDINNNGATQFSGINEDFDEGSLLTVDEILGDASESGGIVANAWKVYSGDGYSKTQVDNNFVAKAVYEETIESYNMIISGYNTVIARLESRIAALEAVIPAAGTNAELDNNGELTLENVNIDENGELDLDGLASLDNEGSLNLQ